MLRCGVHTVVVMFLAEIVVLRFNVYVGQAGAAGGRSIHHTTIKITVTSPHEKLRTATKTRKVKKQTKKNNNSYFYRSIDHDLKKK